MKELLEFLFKHIADYIPVFAGLLSSPKRTILQQVESRKDALNRALVFVGITIAIGFAFQVPLLGRESDFVRAAGAMLAYKIIAILMFSGMLWWIFRILGGQADYVTTLAVYLYIISPLYIAFIVLNVLSMGILMDYDPELAAALRFGQVGGMEAELQQLIETAPGTFAAVLFVLLLQPVLLYLWSAICWGAFRQLHNLSKLRSLFSYLIAGTLLYGMMWIFQFLLKGLYGTGQPELTSIIKGCHRVISHCLV